MRPAAFISIVIVAAGGLLVVVLWLWARALRGKGDAPAAEAVLRSILARFPHSEQAEWARDMLESLRRGGG